MMARRGGAAARARPSGRHHQDHISAVGSGRSVNLASLMELAQPYFPFQDVNNSASSFLPPSAEVYRDRVLEVRRRSANEAVAHMLESLYGDEEDGEGGGGEGGNEKTTCRVRSSMSWCETEQSNSEMVQEWQRTAFEFMSPDTLRDGDQVIRLDGCEGEGRLLFDLASCR